MRGGDGVGTAVAAWGGCGGWNDEVAVPAAVVVAPNPICVSISSVVFIILALDSFLSVNETKDKCGKINKYTSLWVW